MTGASAIAAAQPRNRVQERERQLLIFAISWRTAASDFTQWQLRARTCRIAPKPECLFPVFHGQSVQQVQRQVATILQSVCFRRQLKTRVAPDAPDAVHALHDSLVGDKASSAAIKSGGTVGMAIAATELLFSYDPVSRCIAASFFVKPQRQSMGRC
jgi:hypothetical protein